LPIVFLPRQRKKITKRVNRKIVTVRQRIGMRWEEEEEEKKKNNVKKK
jgi:hypothetical protein